MVTLLYSILSFGSDLDISSNTVILEPRAEYCRTQLERKNSQVERAGWTLNVKNLKFKEFPILNLSEILTSGLVLAQIGSGAARAHRELGAHDQRLLLGHCKMACILAWGHSSIVFFCS